MLVKSFLAKAYLRPFFGYISKMYTPKNELYIGVNASGLYRCFPASQKEYTILFSKSLSPPKEIRILFPKVSPFGLIDFPVDLVPLVLASATQLGAMHGLNLGGQGSE